MNIENFTKFQLFLLKRACELENDSRNIFGKENTVELARINGRMSELNSIISELNDLCD